MQISYVSVIFTLERPLAYSTTRSESAINHKVSERTKMLIHKIFFREDREHFRGHLHDGKVMHLINAGSCTSQFAGKLKE